MNTKYPKVVKTISEESGVEIRFENVIPEDSDSGRRKEHPLTIQVVPHNGMLYLSFTNIGNANLKVEKYGPNQMYVRFVLPSP